MGLRADCVSYDTWAAVVMNQRFYENGEVFRSADIRPAIDRATPEGKDKLSKSSLSTILDWMVNRGLLEKVGTGYQKVRPKMVNGSWRTLTNSQIGIQERHGLGWRGH